MQDLPPYNVAVFSRANELAFVCLEADDQESAAATAVARGYTYAGAIGVNGGEPRVLIEPGCAAVMACAGIGFAEMFGEHLKQYQLQRATRERD